MSLLTLLSQQGAPPPAPPVKVWLRVGGVWKETTVHLKVAGVWKVSTANIKVAGVWKNEVGGGGPDNTPNAVNWPNASTSGSSNNTINQTISGIDSSINIEVSWTVTGLLDYVQYAINDIPHVTMPSSPTTFSISNGQTLKFLMGSAGGPCTVSFTIRNASDGYAILDTFDLTALDS